MAVDQIDQAIAQSEADEIPAGATHFTLNVKLPGGRTAALTVPIDANAVDVFLLTDVMHTFLRQKPQESEARKRLVLPT